MRAILDEWKTITGLDRKTDDALWKRYSAARETFNRRRGSHFAELDRERAGARKAKEALCVRAEELCDSTDWGPTAATFRDLLTELHMMRTVFGTISEFYNLVWRGWCRYSAFADPEILY